MNVLLGIFALVTISHAARIDTGGNWVTLYMQCEGNPWTFLSQDMPIAELCHEQLRLALELDNTDNLPTMSLDGQIRLGIGSVCSDPDVDSHILISEFVFDMWSDVPTVNASIIENIFVYGFINSDFNVVNFDADICNTACISVWGSYDGSPMTLLSVSSKKLINCNADAGDVSVSVMANDDTIEMHVDESGGYMFGGLSQVISSITVDISSGSMKPTAEGWPLGVTVFLRQAEHDEMLVNSPNNTECTDSYHRFTSFDTEITQFIMDGELGGEWLISGDEIENSYVTMGGNFCPVCGDAVLYVVWDIFDELYDTDIESCNNFQAIPIFVQCPEIGYHMSAVSHSTDVLMPSRHASLAYCRGNERSFFEVIPQNDGAFRPQEVEVEELIDDPLASLRLMAARLELVTGFQEGSDCAAIEEEQEQSLGATSFMPPELEILQYGHPYFYETYESQDPDTGDICADKLLSAYMFRNADVDWALEVCERVRSMVADRECPMSPEAFTEEEEFNPYETALMLTRTNPHDVHLQESMCGGESEEPEEEEEEDSDMIMPLDCGRATLRQRMMRDENFNRRMYRYLVPDKDAEFHADNLYHAFGLEHLSDFLPVEDLAYLQYCPRPTIVTTVPGITIFIQAHDNYVYAGTVDREGMCWVPHAMMECAGCDSTWGSGDYGWSGDHEWGSGGYDGEWGSGGYPDGWGSGEWGSDEWGSGGYPDGWGSGEWGSGDVWGSGGEEEWEGFGDDGAGGFEM